jgi:hypothetical protein
MAGASSPKKDQNLPRDYAISLQRSGCRSRKPPTRGGEKVLKGGQESPKLQKVKNDILYVIK